MNQTINIPDNRMIVTLTVGELKELIQSILDRKCEPPKTLKTCSGVKELAAHLSCCESTIYALRRDGVLDGAVVSQIGRRFVYDVDRARELANTYLAEKRNLQ